MKKLLALAKIEFYFTKRSMATFILGIGLPVVLFFIITAMFSSQLDDNIIKQATKEFLISMSVYSSVSLALFTFPSSFQEDRSNNWYIFIEHSPIKMWQYYLVRVIRILANFLIAIIIVFLCGKFIKNVEMTPTEWLVSCALVVFGSTTMLALGFMLTLITSAERLAAVANILYIILGMIGGLWWPLSQFPTFLQKIGKFMPTHHIRELTLHYLKNHEILWQSVSILIGYAIIVIVITFFIKRKIEIK